MAEHTTIGVVSPYLDRDFFNVVIHGAHEILRQHGANLIVFKGTPTEVAATALARERIAGWIVLVDTAGSDQLAPRGTPVVTVSAGATDHAYPGVLPDNRGGMQAAVQHLLGHGHTRIAFIGNPNLADAWQRYEGYQAALTAAGVPLDPALVYFTDDDQEAGGRTAARRLLADGPQCSAVAVATDDSAFGVMEVVRAAGLRMPEDLAIVSFDDIDDAQHTVPPLTSVRQSPHALGRVAATQVLQLLAAPASVTGTTYVPTTLVLRHSCGCGQTSGQARPDPRPLAIAANWQSRLAEQLVQIACSGQPHEPAGAPAARWPGVHRLIQALADAIASGSQPPARTLDTVWQEAVTLTADIETLLSLLRLLEQAAAGHEQGQSHPSAVAEFLDQARLALMRARVAHDLARVHYFEQLTRGNHAISLELLTVDLQQASDLGWLAHTPIETGLLGLWDTAERDGPAQLVLSGAYHRGSQVAAPLGRRYAAATFPPEELLPPTAQTGEHITIVLPVRSTTRPWGLLVVSGPPEQQFTADDLMTWIAHLAMNLERHALLESLSAQEQTLRSAYERERALAATVRELGCPILPVLPHVVLVPLVGVIDVVRAQQIIHAVLVAVSESHATTLLLDITGVVGMDAQVATALLETARAAQLVGARTILVGVRPDIAHQIIGLGLDLSGIATQPTLATAVEALYAARSGAGARLVAARQGAAASTPIG